MNEKGGSTLKICEQKLNYLNYSKRTIDNYLSHINRFLKSQNKSCLHLSSKDFQLYLDNYRFSSVSQQNQIINSIRFLYKFVLGERPTHAKGDGVGFHASRTGYCLTF